MLKFDLKYLEYKNRGQMCNLNNHPVLSKFILSYCQNSVQFILLIKNNNIRR